MDNARHHQNSISYRSFSNNENELFCNDNDDNDQDARPHQENGTSPRSLRIPRLSSRSTGTRRPGMRAWFESITVISIPAVYFLSILSSLNGAIFKHFLSSKYLRWWRSISNVCLFSPGADEAEMDSEEIAFCCGYFFFPNNSLGIFYNSYAAFHIFEVFSSWPVDVEKVRCSRYMWSLFCSFDAY